MRKEMIIMGICILLTAVIVSADSKWNYLTKPYADTLYCSIGGSCNLTDATIINKTYVNQTCDTTTGLCYSVDGFLHTNQDNWFNDSNGWIWWNKEERRPVFNESKLSVIYSNATQVAVVRGTITGGSLIDTQHQDGVYDNIGFNFSEETGAVGLDIRFNFTDGLVDVDNILIRLESEIQTHDVLFQIWNYNDSIWEDYDTFMNSAGYENIEIGVFDGKSHVGNGIIQVRMYHPDNGIIGHDYSLDWIAVAKGFGVPSGRETDPLSIHRDGGTEWAGNDNHSGYNITNVNTITATNEVRTDKLQSIDDSNGYIESFTGSWSIYANGNQMASFDGTGAGIEFLDNLDTNNFNIAIGTGQITGNSMVLDYPSTAAFEFSAFGDTMLFCSLFAGTCDYGLYLQILTDNHIKIQNDNQGYYLGAGDDVWSYFDNSDLYIDSRDTTANDEVFFTDFDRYNFDNDVDLNNFDLTGTYYIEDIYGTRSIAVTDRTLKGYTGIDVLDYLGVTNPKLLNDWNVTGNLTVHHKIYGQGDIEALGQITQATQWKLAPCDGWYAAGESFNNGYNQVFRDNVADYIIGHCTVPNEALTGAEIKFIHECWHNGTAGSNLDFDLFVRIGKRNKSGYYHWGTADLPAQGDVRYTLNPNEAQYTGFTFNPVNITNMNPTDTINYYNRRFDDAGDTYNDSIFCDNVPYILYQTDKP